MDKLEFVYMIVDKKGRPICWEGGMPMIHKTIDGAKEIIKHMRGQHYIMVVILDK